ncbi:MAG: SpoIIE family protein phosphatase [Zoogloeaceae bacterium]|jgi:sigma-B regulation protein RsbU (phosphoserine phosphatase)|nr:SpoIIE family protein phosphatase [Zoogloeaceae bacterium]
MSIPLPKTIQARLILVVVFILAALGAGGMLIGSSLYAHHKALQMSQCRAEVEEQAKNIETTIRLLQNNVRELALTGEMLYQTGAARLPLPGQYAVVHHFGINTQAVGGGIWFEPYVLDAQRERVCYYAFANARGEVVFDPSFESAQYDYPTQNWYVFIKAQLAQKAPLAWTAPYIDETGTRALMTTVGAGMRDADGRWIGMATADWALDDIAAQVAALKPTPGSVALFADVKHDYILALNDPGLRQNPVGQPLALADWFAPQAGGERTLHHNGQTYLSFTRPLPNGMVLAVNVPESELFADIHTVMRLALLAFLSTILLIVLITWKMLNRLVNRPVAALAKAALEIGQGRLDARIALPGHDELGALAAAFNRMADDLAQYIANLNAVTAEKERFSAELGIAHDIQAAMLPSIFPPFPDTPQIDLYARIVPAKQVGGDFYDFFLIGENRLAVVIADVSDKGVPAALFMVIAKTMIRNSAQPGLAPGEILAAANRQLCENNGTGMFVTALFGLLDLQSGVFAYANAGHTPPFIKRQNGAFEPLALPPGMVLAAWENSVYPTAEITLDQGDVLFFYTDGVTEAEQANGEFLGEARLRAMLDAQMGELPGHLRAFIGALSARLDAFTTGAEQHDDITMLVLSYAGNDPAGHEPVSEVRQTFAAETAVLPDFLALVETTLDEAGCPARQRLRFALAAEEIFANIASYAYAKEAAPDAGQTIDVVLQCFAHPERAALRLSDTGRAFNPLQRQTPDITLPPEARKIGGLGVFLAEKNTDGMHYERRDGRNILTLKLVFEKGEA